MPPEDAALIRQAEAYVHRRNLKIDGAAMLTASSALLPAVTDSGLPVMIKAVRATATAELRAPVMLCLYNGHGSVRLLDQYDNLQLLERAVSSRQALWQMATTGQDEAATLIACEVTEKLHSVPWTESVADLLPAYNYKNKPILENLKRNRVPEDLSEIFKAAANIHTALSISYTHRPLHSDLHHWNIVHDEQRGWLSIDPQGLMGPAPATLANMVTNPYDPAFGLKPEFVLNAQRMEKQISLISERMGWDKGDLSRFVFTHSVQIVSRRLGSTPQGQVGLDYWEEAARISGHIAGVRQDRGFVSAAP